MAHCHHFSICNQNQSISLWVIFPSFLGKIPRLQPYFMATNGSFSSLFNLQSKSINFNFGHLSLIVGQTTKAIALLFGHKWLIFITFHSAIKINQFQCGSFFGHLWAKYQGYGLTVWPQMAHFHHFSICNQHQSISILVIVRSLLGKIPRLQPYFLANIASFSSLFNLQSNSTNLNFSHVQAKYQGYSLTCWPKLPHFHHFSICNQNQSISILVIFRSFLGKIPRLQPYFLATNGSFSSLFTLQSQSINFNFGHFSLICGQNTKAIALLFGQKCLIFITFQSAIKINQCQFWSFFAHCWAKYQGYSLTFWPQMAHFHHFSICNQTSINFNFGHCSLICWANYQGYSLTFWPQMAHFHHFSICNQNQSISILVICRSFVGKIPRLQPYFLAKIGSFSSLFNLQSNSTNLNFSHSQAKYQGYSLTFWPNIASFSSLFNLQSKSTNLTFSHFQAKYQGYSFTFWPTLPHFHHFSICSQSQPISILVIFRQNTKAIALLFGQNCLIFITFQSAVKLNQFQFWSFVAHCWAKYQNNNNNRKYLKWVIYNN